jgi:hypothetical protein
MSASRVKCIAHNEAHKWWRAGKRSSWLKATSWWLTIPTLFNNGINAAHNEKWELIMIRYGWIDRIRVLDQGRNSGAAKILERAQIDGSTDWESESEALSEQFRSSSMSGRIHSGLMRLVWSWS